MNAAATRSEDPERQLSERLIQALRGLRYGSIEIVVHDGRVVQFERRERVRFERSDEPRRS